MKSSQTIAAQLSWGETMWIAKQKAVTGMIAPLHANAEPTRLPLYLIPSLPQLSTDYLALADMMDQIQPLFAVYLPSERRKPEFGTSVEALADYYAEAIMDFQPEGALALGGWSAGAVFAEAVARNLLRRNRPVRLLVMLDGAPPALTLPPPGLVGKLNIAASTLATLTSDFAALSVSLVRHARARPDNYSLRRALNSAWQHSQFRLFFATLASARDAKAGRVVDPESRIRPAEIAATIKSLPASHRAFCLTLYDVACRYVPAPAYPGAMLVFETTKEPDRAVNRVAEKWRTIAADIRMIPVTGSHMSIMKSPDGIPLAHALSDALAQCRSGSPSTGQTIPE